ncbi:MAG: hypothetical protein AAF226_00320 [Verrucomicrobiota bacterium]
MRYLVVLCFALGVSLSEGQESPQAAEAKESISTSVQILTAARKNDYDLVIKLTDETADGSYDGLRAEAFQRRGEQRFYDNDIKGSIEDFDAFLELHPTRDPHHWQRGLSYYYAERYQDGKEQFERHQTVNSQDVENAVWHFLCAVRAPEGSVAAARESFIPITEDTRVPMKEVHALFAGEGTADAVLEAAKAEGDPKTELRAKNAFCYAHLYLALYYEGVGEDDKSKEHIAKAANDYRMDHYMGATAVVHAKQRGVKVEKAEKE